MKRSFEYFFLSCSLILILGHSIEPHSHMEKEYPVFEISVVKNLSLTEIITHSLAHNLGANHLNEFRNSKNAVNIFWDSIRFFTIAERIYHQALDLPISLFLKHLKKHDDSVNYTCQIVPLRGPPSQL
jgi:hypothetical protein